MTTTPSIGKALDRVDGKLKVTGAATYAAEVDVAHVAHAVIVGSTGATGSVGAVDIAAARAVSGVLAVLTHENAPKLGGAAKKHTEQERILQLFQDADIHYADHPIALVVAETLEAAQEAAQLIVAAGTPTAGTLAELEPTLAGAYKPAEGPNGQESDSLRGDLAAGLAAATVKHEAVYTTPVETHNPMEMHATIAVWQGEDHLQLYDATQGIFGVRKRLASIFGLPPENVRVTNLYVGGGFGSKGSPWSHIALAAMAAKQLARPVKLVLTRPQMFSLVGHRPATNQKLTLGADAKGALTLIEHEVISETSRIDEFTEPSALQTRHLYSCPNVATSHRLVKLDIPTPTFQRAPGEATGTYALESAMDELAWALKMDPLALRVQNEAHTDEQEKKPFSSKKLLECYRAASEKFGWSQRAKTVRATRDGNELVGWGMATCTYPARQLPASANVRLKADGTFLVQAGTQDIGTGTYTIMTQIAADALGVSFERVRFELGDTVYPETPVSGGSFTASSTGSAVKLACIAFQRTLGAMAMADQASPLFGVPVEEQVASEGAIASTKTPKLREGYLDIWKRSGKPELVVEHQTKPEDEQKGYSMHSHGAVFVEVGVDADLGFVRVRRVVAAYAAGKILNPKTARSQFYGGIVWGIGMALHEHTARDPRTARVVTRDLADYHVPVNADIPDLDIIMIDEEDRIVNAIGAKGIGEIGITGVAAAVANAVYHATGTRVRDLPITLDKLLERPTA